MSEDSRKDFILATIGNFFGYSTSEGAVSHIQNSKELNNFLDDGNCMLLALHPEVVHDVQLIQSYNHVVSEDDSDQWLILFKLQPTTINPDNLHTNIIISSIVNSPISTLYHSVQKLFAPILLKDTKWSKTINQKLQILLTELEAGLGSTLRQSGFVANISAERGTVESGVETSKSSENLYSILTPADELQYWSEIRVSSNKHSTRERAQCFQEILQQIVSEFSNLDALSFSDCLELVEVTQDALDDLWKQPDHTPYPETRMHHLLEVISGTLGRYVQRKLTDLDVWGKSFGHVRTQLQDALRMWEKWNFTADLLTTQFWKTYHPNQWKGSKFVSLTLSILIKRLEEVLNLRSLHEQLIQLLTPTELKEFNLANAFSPFSGMPLFKQLSCTGKCAHSMYSQHHFVHSTSRKYC